MVQAEYIFDEAEFFLHHYIPRYKLNQINWIHVFKKHFMYILKNKTFISKVISTDPSEDKTHDDWDFPSQRAPNTRPCLQLLAFWVADSRPMNTAKTTDLD